MSIQNVAVIGLGLLGGSIGLAVKELAPEISTWGYDRDAQVRAAARERGLVGTVCESAAEAVAKADLVILCVPVGAMEEAAMELAEHLPQGAIISDVGSSKQSVVQALTRALPGHTIIPAHPVPELKRAGRRPVLPRCLPIAGAS